MTLSCCGIIAGCAISTVSRQTNGVPFLHGLPYCRFADTDPHNILEPPTGGGYLCSGPKSTNYIFRSYDSISTWYNIDDTKGAE